MIPSVGRNPGHRPLARAVLAQDPAAEVLSDSSVISVLLSTLWSHPESEQLLVTVYSLLTIISSQGGSAWPCPLSRGVGAAWPLRGTPALPVLGLFHMLGLCLLMGSFCLTVTCSLHKRADIDQVPPWAPRLVHLFTGHLSSCGPQPARQGWQKQGPSTPCIAPTHLLGQLGPRAQGCSPGVLWPGEGRLHSAPHPA